MTTPSAAIEFHDIEDGHMAICLMIDGKPSELCQLKVGELTHIQKSAFLIYQQIVWMAQENGAVVSGQDRRMN